MPSPKEPLVFGCYVDIELTIDGEHHGARSISFSEPTADVPMGPKHGPGPFERKAWCELYLAFWEALHGCPSPQP